MLSGGTANSVGNNSLGGIISSTEVSGSLNSFWDVVSGTESSVGDVEFRCLYVKNNHGSLTLYNAYVWISTNTPSTDTTVAIALGAAAINATEAAIADESAVPPAVSFSAPSSYATGLLIGDIPAGQYKAVWVRRTVSAGAAAYASDSVTISAQGDTEA